ncbi:hypothetical protein IFR04_006483 [Cadophora malorum]|uniref:Alcohol dehydrogenase n=1 Tax=Cadophora malorum TaxID=108018 RepID=A0A8H7W7G2_9HELO|nr:hypothetical protein IFR04_006483 [Cadophora malorum]
MSGNQHDLLENELIDCLVHHCVFGAAERTLLPPRTSRNGKKQNHSVLSAKDPYNGAYAHYSIVPAKQAAILPDSIHCTSGVVIPFALVAAVHALSNPVSGPAMLGVVTPAMDLPRPSLDAKRIGKTLLVYGGSSSVGNMAI